MTKILLNKLSRDTILTKISWSHRKGNKKSFFSIVFIFLVPKNIFIKRKKKLLSKMYGWEFLASFAFVNYVRERERESNTDKGIKFKCNNHYLLDSSKHSIHFQIWFTNQCFTSCLKWNFNGLRICLAEIKNWTVSAKSIWT